ncbi:Thymidylate kinase [Bienertia sinuspersici]
MANDDSTKNGNSQSNPNLQSRGALVVLEGLDRSGKSSQCSEIVSHLQSIGHATELWRFPDRDTAVGKMISAYLSNESNLDDHTIHLLFSANRWRKDDRDKRSLMEEKLKAGTTLIVDRYSYSGVAFSSAKGLDFNWCKVPETGLLAPDIVLYLDITPEKAAERGGYGGERYERLDFQRKVREKYQDLQDASWKIVDACLPMEEVQKKLREHVLELIKACQNGKPFSHLWLC